MSITTHETIPPSFRAGDTVKFYMDSAEFSAADGWALTVSFSAPAQTANKYRYDGSGTPATAESHAVLTKSASGVASGARWLVTIAAGTSGAQSGTFTPGRWSWVAKVALSGEVATIGSGFIDVLPDLSAQSSGTTDDRSVAKVIVENIDLAIRNLTQGKPIESYAIGNRNLKYMPLEELRATRKMYAAIAASDEGRSFTNVEVEFGGETVLG